MESACRITGAGRRAAASRLCNNPSFILSFACTHLILEIIKYQAPTK